MASVEAALGLISFARMLRLVRHWQRTGAKRAQSSFVIWLQMIGSPNLVVETLVDSPVGRAYGCFLIVLTPTLKVVLFTSTVFGSRPVSFSPARRQDLGCGRLVMGVRVR